MTNGFGCVGLILVRGVANANGRYKLEARNTNLAGTGARGLVLVQILHINGSDASR